MSNAGEAEGLSPADRLKQAAGEAAAALVEDGMVVGLGTGSTAAFAVAALGRRVAEGLRIVGIPTSERTAAQARELSIPLSDFAQHTSIDLTIDGADEAENGTLNLIKGLGGALLREKIVASASRHLVIIADGSKRVNRLGGKAALPVEIVPFGWQATAAALTRLELRPALRRTTGGDPFETDGGHYILDCRTGPIDDADALARRIDQTVGTVEHGLFLGLASLVLIATPEGVVRMDRT